MDKPGGGLDLNNPAVDEEMDVGGQGPVQAPVLRATQGHLVIQGQKHTWKISLQTN